MKKLKIVLSVLVISAVILSIFGCSKTEKVGELTIVIKNGEKYIDCSDIKTNDGQDIPFDISMAVRPVIFTSEENMLQSIKNYSFTNEQILQMPQLSSDGLLQLPSKNQSTKLTSSNMSLDKIGWYGGDCYEYDYVLLTGGIASKILYYPNMDREDAVEFIAERNEETNNPHAISVYTENGIEFTKHTGTTIVDLPEKYFQQLYWNYTDGQTTYYVYQHKRVATEALLESSPYTGARIVIKDSYGYHEILINDSTALSITPAFLEQLQVAAVTIETKS